MPAGVLHRLGTELVHHGFGNLVVGTRPDIDNLVIALTVGHETRGILILNFLNLSFSNGQDVALVLGNDHVVYANRNTGHRRKTETCVHQAIGKNDRLLETQISIARVDRVRDGFLRHSPVNKLKIEPGRQYLGQQCTTDSRVDDLFNRDRLFAFLLGLERRYSNLH